jgi:hypothetical protein
MIGHEQLLAAARGHLSGLGLSPQQFDERFRFLGVSAEDVSAVGRAIADIRDPETAPTKRTAYLGGYLDGFALAVAAARMEDDDDA